MKASISLCHTLPTTLYYAPIASPWGWWVMAGTAEGLCISRPIEQANVALSALSTSYPHTHFAPATPALKAQMQAWMQAYINNDGQAIPLILCGTPFQQRVWQALTQVPFGQTTSYAQVATMIGQPSAVRAVATAIGRNRIAPFVPCHRITPKQGGIGQYHWGTELKASLLASETTR